MSGRRYGWVRRPDDEDRSLLRLTDQHGSALLELVIGVPLFLLTAMFVLALVAWPARLNAANVAAYEAAKAVVSADDADSGMATGSERAQEVLSNHGFGSSLVDVSYSGTLERGESVQATVTVRLPVISIPLIGSLASRDFAKSQSQRVADYRGLS